MTPILSEEYIRHSIDQNAKLFRARMITTRILPIYGAVLLILGGITVGSRALADRSPNTSEISKGTEIASDLTASDRKAAGARTCAAWHKMASAAVDTWAATGNPATQVNDAKFRLRRAKRNCAAGWYDLACSDYETLVTGPLPAGDGKRHKLEVSPSCSEL